MSQTKITVRILNREYQFACEEDERTSLLAAADYLNKSMQTIKEKNSTMSSDKIALMAAMNISHELIKSQSTNNYYDTEVVSTIKKLNDKLEQAIATN
ncbi:cell division protein ZapA [Marinicella litoralis]|uniref:Cell division protein ZapA n=1 Tax=Marinicella litoralis TaxID=644220 RepID=A0A4R6XC34_9GAMM|nr:cell division protein ZapA [Marinicella litoralis]TDR16835.1 cell division protein ZapA [Marinicella litoralis]